MIIPLVVGDPLSTQPEKGAKVGILGDLRTRFRLLNTYTGFRLNFVGMRRYSHGDKIIKKFWVMLGYIF